MARIKVDEIGTDETKPKVDEIGTDETKRKNRAVSASISPELYDALEGYRWANRMKVSEVVIAALNAYLECVVGQD